MVEETTTMEPRMKNPFTYLPGAFEALQALHKSVEKAGLPRALLELTNLRASQINGCSVCVDMHSRALKKLGEKDERIFAVSAWREAPYYSDAERAALALTESASRLSDRPDAISDEIWKEAARHYDETQLSALVVSIGAINLWNRLNAATRLPDPLDQIEPPAGRRGLPVGEDAIFPQRGRQIRRDGYLAWGWVGLLAFEIERDGLLDEPFQRGLVETVALAHVDGSPVVSVETRVEHPGAILHRGALGERDLDESLESIGQADVPVVGPDGSPPPLPLFDDVRVCLLDELAHPGERLPAPVPQLLDSRVDARGRRP